MKVNIYYGGRGLIEDPTIYVINKIEEVLKELRVDVKRYNLFELKNNITTLPQSFKEVDGIVLAASVEWRGIGGLMQEFLDACWLYGDKEKISKLYMSPVVIATTYGEKEAMLDLKNAWELLGGLPCSGLSAYVEDSVDFEMNVAYTDIIEKKAENIYRTISQKKKSLPSSNYAIKQNLIKDSMNLTPQESEQLSKYASDDIYVKKQKEDIEQLTNMFKDMLTKQGNKVEYEFVDEFVKRFVPQDNVEVTYAFHIEDKDRTLVLNINNSQLECKYEECDNADVFARMNHDVLNNIVRGRSTFQRAFMTGEMAAKGNFNTLRLLDQMFPFE
ncbi:SCP2 sterol-binding domain-containing protein [Lachnospiraceae bacterium HCP1S3_C3]|nr:SCP2 sterol-binding domain-containing protein [Lachnospiraceae bacterium]